MGAIEDAEELGLPTVDPFALAVALGRDERLTRSHKLVILKRVMAAKGWQVTPALLEAAQGFERGL